MSGALFSNLHNMQSMILEEENKYNNNDVATKTNPVIGLVN